MKIDTKFVIRELAPLCGSTVKRVTEPIRVYQAFGIVCSAGKKIFQYKGYEGLHRSMEVGKRLIRNSELERFRHEDPPSPEQRIYFRRLCLTASKEAALPTPRQGLDSLSIQAWCFFILHLWLGETSIDRTDLLITVKATARESKSRPRTTILKACRPLSFHGIPLFSFDFSNRSKCKWIGSGLQSIKPTVVTAKVPLPMNPKIRRMYFSSDREKKMRLSLSTHGTHNPRQLSHREENMHGFRRWTRVVQPKPFVQAVPPPKFAVPPPKYAAPTLKCVVLPPNDIVPPSNDVIPPSNDEAVSLLLQLQTG
jgi:hypothetical protein